MESRLFMFGFLNHQFNFSEAKLVWRCDFRFVPLSGTCGCPGVPEEAEIDGPVYREAFGVEVVLCSVFR